MLYVKNVPPVERVIRVLMGIGLLVAAVLWLGANAKGWIVGAMGMMAAMSGLIGWCPMCAMVGRKLDAGH
jgi:hypothetical protein